VPFEGGPRRGPEKPSEKKAVRTIKKIGGTPGKPGGGEPVKQTDYSGKKDSPKHGKVRLKGGRKKRRE